MTVYEKQRDMKEVKLMRVEKREQLYEGKAKKVYGTNDERYCIVSYKDDATAFNGLKKGTILGLSLIHICISSDLKRATVI